MNEENDKWKKLINLTDGYEPDPDLADGVIEKINQRESTVKFKKVQPVWISAAAFLLVCCIFLVIFLPVYFSGRSPVNIYFSDDKIEYSEVQDVESFAIENNLKFRYYFNDMTVTQCAKITDDNRYAFIVQDMFYLGDTGFDSINMKAVLINNAEFEFCENFKSLSSSVSTLNIPIYYSLIENINGNLYRAKFAYENIEYYLEISTSDSGENVIEKYVNLLID